MRVETEQCGQSGQWTANVNDGNWFATGLGYFRWTAVRRAKLKVKRARLANEAMRVEK